MEIEYKRIRVDKKVFSSRAKAVNNTVHLDKGTQEGGDRCVGGAGKVVMINIGVEIQS